MPTATRGAPLPFTIDVFKLASQGSSLSGQFAAKHLPRLAEATLEIGEAVNAELQFFVGEQGLVEVTGLVCGEVTLTCQRCLGAVRKTLSSEFALAVIRDEADVVGVPRHLDPWLVDTQAGDLRAMLEDELLLTLPIVALHEREHCEPDAAYSLGADDPEGGAEAKQSAAGRRPNPFQVLEQLKKDL